jgi:hypothetical protein
LIEVKGIEGEVEYRLEAERAVAVRRRVETMGDELEREEERGGRGSSEM